MKIEINKISCKRCKHEWTPRKEEVKVCPKCKSPYWDTEPRGKIKGDSLGDKLEAENPSTSQSEDVGEEE